MSTAIEWNYDVRKRRLVSELDRETSGFESPVCVVAGLSSRDFVRELKRIAPQTQSKLVQRIGDQYLAVWKWRECNKYLLEFAEAEVFTRVAEEEGYLGRLRREKASSDRSGSSVDGPEGVDGGGPGGAGAAKT